MTAEEADRATQIHHMVCANSVLLVYKQARAPSTCRFYTPLRRLLHPRLLPPSLPPPSHPAHPPSRRQGLPLRFQLSYRLGSLAYHRPHRLPCRLLFHLLKCHLIVPHSLHLFLLPCRPRCNQCSHRLTGLQLSPLRPPRSHQRQLRLPHPPSVRPSYPHSFRLPTPLSLLPRYQRLFVPAEPRLVHQLRLPQHRPLFSLYTLLRASTRLSFPLT